MTWLGSLWWRFIDTCSGLCDRLGHIVGKPLSKPVCEDILMEIFSRMPAESLHQCKLVYEDWNTLFSTPYFNYNMFLPRASPTIIVQHWKDGHKVFYIDDDHRGGLKCKPISSKNPISCITPIRFSCYGLLFVDNGLGYTSTVLNPVTERWTTIPSWYSNIKGEVCGAYIHPTTKEFHVLWVSKWKTYVEFTMFRRRSEEPGGICWNALLKLQSRTITYEPPVNLHDCLHWMCYGYTSIMVFSVIKEEFTIIMSSIPGAQSSPYRSKPYLLDLDGYLSLGEVTDGILNIWTVDDYYASWSWTKRYSMDVKLLHKMVNIKDNEVSVVGFQNGALVIHWRARGIFVHHLQHKSTKKFLFGKSTGSHYYGTSSAFLNTNTSSAFLHTKSLISF